MVSVTRAILSAQPQRSRSRDQNVTGRRTIRPASSDMTLSSCGGSCGPRCRQRSGRRDRGCSRRGAIAHLAPPPRQERQVGGWRRLFVTSTSRDRKTPRVGAAWRRGWLPSASPRAIPTQAGPVGGRSHLASAARLDAVARNPAAHQEAQMARRGGRMGRRSGRKTFAKPRRGRRR